MYTRHIDVHMYVVAYMRSIGRGMKGYPRYRKTFTTTLRQKFGGPAGVSATNYACVGYELFTHRECENARGAIRLKGA